MAHGNRGVRFYRGSGSDISLSGTPYCGLRKGAEGGFVGASERNRSSQKHKKGGTAARSKDFAGQEKGTTPEEIEETRARIKAAREKKSIKGRMRMENKIREINNRFERGLVSEKARDAMIAKVRKKHEEAELRNRYIE